MIQISDGPEYCVHFRLTKMADLPQTVFLMRFHQRGLHISAATIEDRYIFTYLENLRQGNTF